MGTCFLYGNGGAGSSGGLNIIVGISEPASAKDNTIWVKSAAASRKYVFAEEAPASPTSGLVWFSVTSAGVITKANVYANGVWTAADTYMYLSGKWIKIASSWNGELFDNGNLYREMTGGWAPIVGTLSSSDPYLLYSAGAGRLIMASGKKIDITNYAQLHVIGRGRGDYSANGGVSTRNTYFGIATAVADAYDGVTFAARLTLGKGYNSGLDSYTTEQVLDITSFTGEHFIAAAVDTTATHTNANIGIKRMWLT